MTLSISELHRDENLRQAEFPVTRSKIFLAHAGVCSLPRRVAQAIHDYTEQSCLQDQEAAWADAQIQRARELGARLLQAEPDEIALVGPTSLGLSYVAAGLKFRRRANIIVYFDDYPSNVYPWLALADRGVEVRFLNIRQLGCIRPIDVLGQVDESTRLVALASCHFIAGFRIDLEAIGAALRERGILFCVDGIQTVGAFPTPVKNVDFLAADAHKWMLGPCAAGLLYVRRAVQDQLNPVVFGWNNVRCPDFVAQEEFQFRTGGRRYEAGTHNLLGLVGMTAAMEMSLEVGIDAIAEELLRKRNWLVPALQAKGYTVLEPESSPSNASGILSFFRPQTNLADQHERLHQGGVVASLRADRTGQAYLRLSPHYYNTDAELHRALELL